MMKSLYVQFISLAELMTKKNTTKEKLFLPPNDDKDKMTWIYSPTISLLKHILTHVRMAEKAPRRN